MLNIEPLYFDLIEAIDILSAKLSINNLTPKKLIKLLSQLDIPLHIYGYGFSISGDFDIIDKSDLPKNQLINHIEKDLSGWNTETGSLFQLPEYSAIHFQFYNTLLISHFEDMIPLKTLKFANNALESIKLTLTISITEITSFEVLAIYPFLSLNHFNQGEILNGLYGGIEIKPKFTTSELDGVDSANIEKSELAIDNFIIHFNDLLLLKSNLHLLLAYLSGEKEYSPNYSQAHTKPPLQNKYKNTGVSPQKTSAKSSAKTFAQYFWSQDKNKKIKIGQMCEKVYFALYETDHKDQLPDQFISIKPWIKDIAPDYASEAGRIKN